MLLNKDDSILFCIDIQVKLTPLIHRSRDLIDKCVWLQQLAAATHVPILIAEQHPEGLGSTIPELDQLTPEPSKIKKTSFSCMQSHNFIETLKKTKKNQCVLSGIETHVCILQTAIEMRSSGLEVFIVADAVGSRNPLDHEYALERMRQEKIHIITTEMVFFEWIRDSANPKFKALSKQFLQ